MIYDRLITISRGASRKALNWQPEELYISELYKRLEAPTRGTETQADYLSYTKSRQDELKDVGGFVAGKLAGQRRKANAVLGRDVLTLDLDSIPPYGTEDVCRRVDALGCGFYIYSTRKHMPSAPRLRVLLPLDRTCSADEYEPCARKVAELIGIGYADPSTFEASRLMYWPSCSSDGEYVHLGTLEKPFLSVDGLLSLYADWHDTKSWPTVPGAPTAEKLAAKQEDPTGKPGVVGAFCRVYNIEAAMAAFLPGVYEPVDGTTERYTYTGGTTTGGAVLYDNGAFLLSHHATDPCSGKLVNAFDLVRLHKFGALDDDAQPGTPTVRLPSYTAMTEFARADKEVGKLMLDERWERAQNAFTPLEAPETPQEDSGEWRRLLTVTGTGAPEKSMRNIQTVLEHDPALAGKLRLNLFSGRMEVQGTLPWKRPTDSPIWGDDDAAQLRLYMEPFFGKVSKNDILDAVAAVASNAAYHPVRDYLNSLKWDGTERLDRLFIDYLGAIDSAYVRAVTRKSLVAAVARVMTPGVKYDTMLVLVGAQGRYKSTILAKLGGGWFSDSLRTFGDKDSMETIQGTWINEIAEMQALAKSDIDAAKMFLSKTRDYYRAAYGRYTADRPRQCVFFGTSNSLECLSDQTGNRRFWPVDIDASERTKSVSADLDAERDQIWAEAVVRWKAGEVLYLTGEKEKEAIEAQEGHRAMSAWEGVITAFLDENIPAEWASWDAKKRTLYRAGGLKYDGPLEPRRTVCAVEVYCEALGGKLEQLTLSKSREINRIISRVPGWKSVGPRRTGTVYGLQRCFSRATD